MTARTTLLLALVLALPLAARAADPYKVDGVHSAVVFRVKHLNVGYAYGRFNDLSGTVALDEADPAQCAFDLQVKAESVDTANAKRDGHLRGPDFLNVKEFPVIAFKSTAVKLAKANVYDVTGDLTLHGVTKTVTVPITRVGSGKDPFGGGSRTGFEANVTVRRADHGMTFMPAAIGDDVWLLISFEAVKP